jgi:hypothetical protein
MMARQLPRPDDSRGAEFLPPRLQTVRDREQRRSRCAFRQDLMQGRPEVRTYPSSQTGVALQATGSSPEA